MLILLFSGHHNHTVGSIFSHSIMTCILSGMNVSGIDGMIAKKSQTFLVVVQFFNHREALSAR